MAIRSLTVIACLKVLKSRLGPEEHLIGGSYKDKCEALTQAASFFGVSDERLTPHGLRRGGATWFFSVHDSYDATTAHGRWAHVATCRIYIDQAAIDQSRFLTPTLERKKLATACLNLDSLLRKAFGLPS